MQGPAEVLPISSSGHLILLGSRDKAFEVFVHAGTACALLLTLPFPRVRPLMLAPAAVAGLLLERPIDARLGPRSVAIAQIGGGLALILADSAPARRSEADLTPRDELLIGLAQALALAPGISRNGATLTAARVRGFRRDAANRISRDAALPVIAGATALKLARLRSARPSAQHVAGFAAAFASGLAAGRVAPRIDRLRSHAPFGLYRVALGVIALRVMRLNDRDG